RRTQIAEPGLVWYRGSKVCAQPRYVGGGVGGLGDCRDAGRADDVQQLRGVDRAGLDRGVPVTSGAELIPRVVAVHQVDPAGDGPDPVHDAVQVLTARVRVAGVEAEADHARAGPVGFGEPPDGVPEALQRVEAAGHRVVAARGVLDQQRYRPFYPLDRLPPVGVALGVVDPAGDVPAGYHQALGPDPGRRGKVLPEQLAAGRPGPAARPPP